MRPLLASHPSWAASPPCRHLSVEAAPLHPAINQVLRRSLHRPRPVGHLLLARLLAIAEVVGISNKNETQHESQHKGIPMTAQLTGLMRTMRLSCSLRN